MSEPPIYPKGCDADLPVDTTFGGDFHYKWSVPGAHVWPHMLGLLTIIGNAVRGVPWGKPAEPELPWPDPDEWYAQFHGTQIDVVTAYRSVVDPTVVAVWLDHEDADPIHLTREEFWASYRPATVIPTPTADAWLSPADELPAPGQDIWRWTADAGTYLEVMWSADIEHWRQVLAAGGTLTWRWMPFPPSVVPPPPADRDGWQ